MTVREFIQENYTSYDGDSSFLVNYTDKTKKLLNEYERLLKEEHDKGGVLDINVDTVSGILSYSPAFIDKDSEVIFGLQTNGPLIRGLNPFGGMRMAEGACEAYGYKVNEKIKENFKYKTTHNDGVFKVYTSEIKKLRKSGVLTGLPDAYGRGRIIGDYRRVALFGMDELIFRKELDYERYFNEDVEEYIKVREELYDQIQALKDLKEMALLYGDDISKPATTTREAIQWTYYGYLAAIKEQNGAAMSLGRVSTFFDIYIENDLKNNKITEELAQELIDQFVLKLRMVRQLRTPEYNDLFAGDPNWVTECIGGVGVDGRHMVTKTSYRFLHTLYNLNPSPEPNLTILWSKNLPDNFKKYCAKVSIETNSIQYENDDIMRPIYGDDYGIACCVSAMEIGKQMQFFGARCNLAKLLLMSLNNGKDELTGEQIAPQLTYTILPGENDEILSYDMTKLIFERYVYWLAEKYVSTMNMIHYMHDKYAYEKIQMALHDLDIERLMAFGIAGFSVVVDSLSAIKFAKVRPIRREDGLILDYEIEGDFPKYGNDDDRVDEIAIYVSKLFSSALKNFKTYRKSIHTLSLLTITSNVVYGKKTGATPDGRRGGEPFAPGANPMHGRDSSGALASLNSVAKISYDDCRDGISNTFNITSTSLGINIDEQSDNLVSVLDGYFILHGHHINVNSLTKEMLLDAQTNPMSYPNLTIRVSGYAVRFSSLNKIQQDEVISRTFH